ncbi:ATP-binding protein [Streptomyces yangpuensis]|uniref:ATP-binding protein n=1 Tax=Streptomyces yangpuensis TaxID=1648182 RepID=UPI0038263AA5
MAEMTMATEASGWKRRTADEPAAAPAAGTACPAARHTHPREDWRDHHTGGTQPLLLSFSVPAQAPAAVSRARRLLLSAVRAWELPFVDDALDDLALLSGEIIANAVLHTAGPCSVTVRWTGVRVRVEVADTAAGLPRQCGRELNAESGRGLSIVAALAAGWGSADTATGKVIWFEVAPSAPTLDPNLNRPAS